MYRSSADIFAKFLECDCHLNPVFYIMEQQILGHLVHLADNKAEIRKCTPLTDLCLADDTP